MTLKGRRCRNKSGNGSFYCPSHNQQITPKEWLPIVLEYPKSGTQPHNWAEWLRKHATFVQPFTQLTEDQLEKLSGDLGYSSSRHMLRELNGATVERTAYVRVGKRQLRDPLELLSTAVHEVMHCIMPKGLNDLLEESICVIVEANIKKRWMVHEDFKNAIATATCMHPANKAAATELPDPIRQLQLVLHTLGSRGGSMAPLMKIQPLETVLKVYGIDEDALHVCRDHGERLACQALEYDAFFDRGMPGHLGGDEVVLVHGVRDDPLRTMIRLHTSSNHSVYIGAFVSTKPGCGHSMTAMALLCKLVKVMGMKYVELHSEDLPRLRKVYTSLRFKHVKRIRDFYGEGRAGLFWQREI
jgi:hypothetical protein